MGFKQFKLEDGEDKDQTIFVQFREAFTGTLIGKISEAFSIDEEEFLLRSSPASLDTKAIIEFSYNKKEWTDPY